MDRSRILTLLAALLALLMLSGCGPKRIVHCDRCGKAIEVPEDSKFTEDWILFCEDCAEEVEPVIE